MPELAEVEYVRKVTAIHTLHKTITNVTVFEDELVFVNRGAHDIETSLLNSKVVNVCRKGKIFWMVFDSAPHISFHLGMSGRMMVRGHDILTYYRYPDKNIQNKWPPRFAKLVIGFNDKTEIAFTNTRRFGRVRLHSNLPDTEQPICDLGYDPFCSMCTLHEFTQLISKKKCALKAALLNQSFTAGVGNWIADEVCYQSGVYPGVYCNTLNDVQINRVYESLQSITSYAVSVDANYDKFPSNWLFHYRWNKGKKKEYHTDCYGNEIVFEKIGGRTTAIVCKLQSKKTGYRMFKNSEEIGKIKKGKQVLKAKKKYKLLDVVKKRKRKYEKRDEECYDDNEIKQTPLRKKRKLSVLNIIPIALLRRSARLASKQTKVKSDPEVDKP